MNTKVHRSSSGFSYLEVLIAALIIAIALTPALQALSRGVESAGAHERMRADYLHVSSLMEETLAESLVKLEEEAVLIGDPTVSTKYSDGAGAERRRFVYLSLYDLDNADADGDRFTGGEPGIVWVRVELENSNVAFEALTGY